MRFGSEGLTKLCSISQMVKMGLYLGICLYTPSLALSTGGAKAVVYTDVVQTLIMFIGILVVVIVVCIELGGVGAVFDIAENGGRIEIFNFDMSPFARHTFISVQVLGLYFITSVVGISQPQFQRLNSYVLCFSLDFVILWSLFYFTGLVAYAAYADCDPLATKQIEKADQIVPFLVADKLKHLPGMAGLFVAAVYGGVLSTVSSQANAFAALIWEDFLCNWIWFRKNIGISATNVTRLLSAFAGLMGVGLAFIVARLGTIFQVTYSVSGALIGPLDGLFITAISAPWVNKKGAFVGFVTSFLFNVWLLIGQMVYETGKTANLPLSTSGCPEELLNLTLQSNNMNDTLILEVTTTYENLNFEAKDKGHLLMYDISYCYIGTIGILIVFIVSTLVSILTVYGPSLYVYKKLWEVFSNKKTVTISTEVDVKSSNNYMDCVTYTHAPSESIEENEEKTL
ncbi:Sodium-coupled monocarboxylate transporter 1 [Armadillidium nasatum]|uniref:Sodium-coupled monocarboxylate transporter 1 n=1 Tax=Armadillidium nasatum TaxID=96803 RepID=A0A5N5SJX6_9CRUS|nr:Sodium-coupled monocarboxylate transporter 1 [Armadillidium nasatum]